MSRGTDIARRFRPQRALLLAITIALVFPMVGCAGVSRKVTAWVDVKRAHWSPDSQRVIVSVERARSVDLHIPGVPAHGTHGSTTEKDEIYVIDVVDGAKPKRIATGSATVSCPGRTLVAYYETDARTKQRLLWLMDYETGRKWELGDTGKPLFSPDGRWFTWGRLRSTHRVAPADDPTQAKKLNEALKPFAAQGWFVGKKLWSSDVTLYFLFYKEEPNGRLRAAGWSRCAPPDWKMEALGPELTKEQKESLVFDKHRSLSDGVRSPDGTMLLKSVKDDRDWENLFVEFPDGTVKQITHFRAPK